MVTQTCGQGVYPRDLKRPQEGVNSVPVLYETI